MQSVRFKHFYGHRPPSASSKLCGFFQAPHLKTRFFVPAPISPSILTGPHSMIRVAPGGQSWCARSAAHYHRRGQLLTRPPAKYHLHRSVSCKSTPFNSPTERSATGVCPAEFGSLSAAGCNERTSAKEHSWAGAMARRAPLRGRNLDGRRPRRSQARHDPCPGAVKLTASTISPLGGVLTCAST